VREQFHEQRMLALKMLQLRYAEQGHWAELANVARQQLAIVPWEELAHRNLMQALASLGQSQAALAQFEKCREILQQELGIEPSLATLDLAARLRGAPPTAPSVQHNLAQPLKSFVGRKDEIASLNALVRTQKLVTLLGIGGVGKSHLALTIAQSVLHDFADGVWFVPLVNIEAGDAAPERIALAIAATVGFQVTNMQPPLVEVATYLAAKQMLLVLDNWEHLLESAATVFDALRPCRDVHILATSRVRLLDEEETIIQLEGLPPTEAFTLFVDRARRIVPTFATEEDAEEDASIIAADVASLCQQMAGLPLGIELAASWIEHYSAAEIGQSIAKITIQPQQSEGLVGRHHQLSGVFEYSWQLLNLRQQQILSRLSVFRGGFDRTAAVTVAEGTLSELSTLISHSLVQRVGSGRYDLHPLLQEFAARKLAPDEAPLLHGKHSQHYLSTLLATPRAQQAARLLADSNNIRAGWQRAVHAGDDALVQTSLRTFGDFMAQFGLLSDGNKLFEDALAQFDHAPEHDELVAELLDQQALFVRALQGLSAVKVLQQRVLALTKNRKLQISSHNDLANFYAEVGAWEEADFHFDRLEELASELPDLGAYITAVESRIHINAIHFRGDFAKGIARLEELLTLMDTTTTPITDAEYLRVRILQSLALISIRYGDYAAAIQRSQQVLAWTHQVGHRPRQCYALIDLALAEQFAGMYTEAIAHNHEALALAEEIGDVDETGLVKANLCLTLRQHGELEQALAYGLEAIQILSALGNEWLEGQARNRVGHTLSALGRWGNAYAMYGEALVVWEPLQHPNRYEAVAGRAAAACQLGKHDEALALVHEAMDFVAAKGLAGIVEPARLLLNCEAVLSALGQSAQASQALLQADAWMQTIASRISDDAVRAAFLRNKPDNQLLKSRLDLSA
jgi:predicted ATPase